MKRTPVQEADQHIRGGGVQAEEASDHGGTLAATDETVIRLPWSLIGAALVCNAALFWYTRFSPIILVLALGLTLTRFIDWRLPNSNTVQWMLRFAAYFAIYLQMPKSYTGRTSLFDPAVIAMVGTGWAIEVVLQAWRKRPAGTPPGSGIILLTALEFCAAATVDEGFYFFIDGNYVMYLAPVYMLLVLISLRTLETSQVRQRTGSDGHALIDTDASRPRKSPLFARIIAFAIALAAGFACWLPLHLYRHTLSNWADGFSAPQIKTQETAGLSIAPSLGSMLDVQGSDQRVLRLTHYEGDAHLRGASFDTYHNGGWAPSLDLRHFNPAGLIELNATARGSKSTVTCFTAGLNEVVAPLNAAGISDADDVDRSIDAGVVLQTSAPPPYDYDIIQSNDPNYQGILTTPLTAAERARCLNVPKEISPQVRDLATRIWADAQKDADREVKPGVTSATPPSLGDESQAKINAVTAYLITHYSYSLSYQPGRGDRVSDFLLNHHASYCEYFASAAAILLRCLNVPTRYVTGYYAHELENGATIVRQRDAHAWTECWVDGIGWVTADATPGDGRPSALYRTAPFIALINEWVADRFFGITTALTNYSPIQIGLGIVAAITALYGLRRLRRRRRLITAQMSFEYASGSDEALRDAGRRFEAYLARRGIPCPATLPWEDHIKLLRDAKTRENAPPADAEPSQELATAANFVHCYNALRFGSARDIDRIAEASRILADLERQTT